MSVVDEVIARMQAGKPVRAAKPPKLTGSFGISIPNVELELGQCWYCQQTATKDCCPKRKNFLALPREEQAAIRAEIFGG